MKAFLISAMHSGAGKTVMSAALMAALKQRGLCVQGFKCGPDYIDPMFHSRVLGLPGRNLDLFLQGEAGVRQSFFRAAATADVAVLEGAMGYYDGLNNSTQASAWELACCLNLPAVLVLRPKGVGLTLAAQLGGMLCFRPESHITGILLADCGEHAAARCRNMLEAECGLPVLGFLPPMEEARIESRHLGLMTAGEIDDLSLRFEHIARQAAQTIDLDRLLSLAADIPSDGSSPVSPPEPVCRIAVARDEAFCFLYEDSLEALRNTGAELCFFSPLRDTGLPEGADGLYFCGGYPELYAARLAENAAMRAAVREAVRNGMPTLAECGGFLYLQETLEDPDGTAFPMCGALPGHGYRTTHLQRFGYLTLTADTDSLLFRAGEHIPAHEFHYWDSTVCGEALLAQKADGRSWRCGIVTGRLYAAFPHLHLGGTLPLAERFVKACVNK